MQPASAVATWITVLRAAETLRFTSCVPWGDGLWFVSWPVSSGRRCRDIVIEPDGSVWTKEDSDV